MAQQIKNWLIKKLLFPIRQHENTGRALVVSTTGLGDSLWGTPAIRELAKTTQVSLLTSPIGAAVYQNNPHIDEIFITKHQAIRTFCPLMRKLRAKKFDTVYFFHASQRLTYPLAYFTGAKTRIATAHINKGLDSLFTHTLDNRHKHELLRRLEIANISTSPHMELFPTEEDHRLAALFAPGDNLIGLHPGSKDLFKRWDKRHFINIAQRFPNHQIIISGTPQERPLLTEIARAIPNSKIAILPLLTFAALINRMQLIITNDTGPMHIAFAMSTPTIGLFSATDPKLYGPLTGNHRILHAKKTCTPCLHRKCRKPFCLDQITEEDVWNASVSLFSTGTEKTTPSAALPPSNTSPMPPMKS